MSEKPKYPYVELEGEFLNSTVANPGGTIIRRPVFLRVTGAHRSLEAVRRHKKRGWKYIGYGNFPPNHPDYRAFAAELDREYGDSLREQPAINEAIEKKVKAIKHEQAAVKG